MSHQPTYAPLTLNPPPTTQLLSPSPLPPPLTLRTVLEYVLVSVVARQILQMTIIYIISLILIIPVYILDVIVFDYTVLDIIVMYFVVSAICRFVKRSLAFPRGYCSDYWGIWAPTLNTLNATFEKTFNDASGLPPDHPLRNLDVLPPYNLHHIKMVRQVAESLTIYKEDQERWEFLEDVKFCLEVSEIIHVRFPIAILTRSLRSRRIPRELEATPPRE